MPDDLAPPSDRLDREQQYYNRYWGEKLEQKEQDPIDTAPIAGRESRPYNCFWAAMQIVREFGIRGKRVLEMGCGIGDAVLLLASQGAEVHAFDISDTAVEGARRRARRHGLEDHVHLSVGNAEKMEYPSGFFEFIYGYGILHHIDVARAAPEIHRVLKPGGQAVFIEWISWPLFERIRNQPLMLRWFPHGGFRSSTNITEDERKLGRADERILRATFPFVEYRYFYFFHRLTPFLPRYEVFFQKLDHWLLQALPSLRHAAAAAVIVVRK